MYVFIQPLQHRQGVKQDQFLSRVQQVCIQSFLSKLVTKPSLKKLSLSNYSPIAGGGTGGFMLFLRTLV